MLVPPVALGAGAGGLSALLGDLNELCDPALDNDSLRGRSFSLVDTEPVLALVPYSKLWLLVVVTGTAEVPAVRELPSEDR